MASAGDSRGHALVDLIPHRFHPGVRQLLGAALGVGSDAVVQQELQAYLHAPRRRLLGFLAERTPLALLGLDFLTTDSAIVLHLAVAEEQRRIGLGRQLLRAAVDHYGLDRLSAASDPVAARFYQALGFNVRSMGESLPGMERFECVWQIDHGNHDAGI